MPVPTETFYNIKKLNLVFAVTAILLLLSTGWLVVEDYNREWRKYQRQTVTWQLAMTTDAQSQAQVTTAQVQLFKALGGGWQAPG